MKILFLNWRDITNPAAGGAEVFLHEIGKRLAKNHEIHLYCAKYKDCNIEEELDGIRIIRRGGTFSIYLYAIFYYLLKLRGENFDVIVDCINGVPFFTPLFIRKPKLVIIHHIVGRKIFFKELPFPLAVIAWSAERIIPLVYRRSTMVTVSETSRDELVEFGIASKRIKVVYNAIDHEILQPGAKNKIPLIAYIGRIKNYKRLSHLVEAFSLVHYKVSKARLLIAGRGDYGELEMLVMRLKLEPWVSLIGEVSDEDKIGTLQKAWVLVTPSMKEGWGITVLEANSCGTPSIAYNVLGLRDSIINGQTGLLVPDGDINSLADAVINVLSNHEFRNKLSSNALKWASKFNWGISTDKFEQFLESEWRDRY